MFWLNSTTSAGSLTRYTQCADRTIKRPHLHYLYCWVVSLFYVDSGWSDHGQQELFNSPLVIGQSGCHRGGLPLPPALLFLHPDRKRLERPCEDPRPNPPK